MRSALHFHDKRRELSGDMPGIDACEIGLGTITVRFAEGGTYLYDQTRPGKQHVAQMIALARAGGGLATYIDQQLRGNYARKID